MKQELTEDKYRLDVPVDICMMVDTSSIYRVGEGQLVHTKEGFYLTGCGGGTVQNGAARVILLYTNEAENDILNIYF